MDQHIYDKILDYFQNPYLLVKTTYIKKKHRYGYENISTGFTTYFFMSFDDEKFLEEIILNLPIGERNTYSNSIIHGTWGIPNKKKEE